VRPAAQGIEARQLEGVPLSCIKHASPGLANLFPMTSQYARIFVAVDGSTQGDHALRYAVGLAKALGAALRNLAQIAAARRAEGQKLLAAAAEVALVEEAASWPADLVVLGARGRGAVERLLLGSVADGVARRTTIPVLLVH
jgi:nucleotide-binding universal stress UspA family protein